MFYALRIWVSKEYAFLNDRNDSRNGQGPPKDRKGRIFKNCAKFEVFRKLCVRLCPDVFFVN